MDMATWSNGGHGYKVKGWTLLHSEMTTCSKVGHGYIVKGWTVDTVHRMIGSHACQVTSHDDMSHVTSHGMSSHVTSPDLSHVT